MCLEPAELQLAGGRVQVTPGTQFTIGTKFMNIELARMLEDEYKRQQRRH